MLEDIIDELETIANAFESVESFIYGRPSAVNWKSRTKGYPCILVSSEVDFDPEGTNTKDLIKKKGYKLTVFVYDEYQISEQNMVTLQAKQEEIETILDQYVAEIRRRTKLDSTKKFIVGGITSAFHAYPVHNDKLAQVSCQLELIGDSSCGTGTFEYE